MICQFWFCQLRKFREKVLFSKWSTEHVRSSFVNPVQNISTNFQRKAGKSKSLKTIFLKMCSWTRRRQFWQDQPKIYSSIFEFIFCFWYQFFTTLDPQESNLTKITGNHFFERELCSMIPACQKEHKVIFLLDVKAHPFPKLNKSIF